MLSEVQSTTDILERFTCHWDAKCPETPKYSMSYVGDGEVPSPIAYVCEKHRMMVVALNYTELGLIGANPQPTKPEYDIEDLPIGTDIILGSISPGNIVSDIHVRATITYKENGHFHRYQVECEEDIPGLSGGYSGMTKWTITVADIKEVISLPSVFVD